MALSIKCGLRYNVHMNKILRLRSIYLLFVGIMTILLATNSYAKCDPSIAPNYPTDTPPNFYGNGQTDSFRCAITGSTDVSTLEQMRRDDLIPTKLSDRWYVMLGGNAASEGVTSVKNDSIYDPVLSGGTVSSGEATTASNNIELAFGYAWSEFAVDLEWLAIKSIAYNGSILNTGVTANYSTTLKGDSTLLNIYWLFSDQYNFKMYATMCLGLTSNKTTASLNNSASSTVNKWSPSYGIGVGARFNIISKLFADMAVRYIFLGKAKYEAASGARYLILRASRTWAGVSARLLWMI